MNTTYIAILSAFFAAIANILARILLKKFKSRDMLSTNFLVMTLTLAVLSPLFYSFTLTGKNILLICLISLVDAVANYFYLKTFEQTEASVATPMLSLAPGFTFLFGWLVLGDIVSLQTYLFAFGIIILILIFSIDFKDFVKFRSSTLIPALMSSILFGISAIPSKMLFTAHAINAPTLYMFRGGIIAVLALVFFRKPVKLAPREYVFIFIRGLFVIAQWIMLYMAISSTNAGVGMTLGNITPIFVFLLSIIFLQEKPTWKKAIVCGLVLAISLII